MVGDCTFRTNTELTPYRCPHLRPLVSRSSSTNNALEALNFDGLTTVGTDLPMVDNGVLDTLEMPELVSIGGRLAVTRIMNSQP